MGMGSLRLRLEKSLKSNILIFAVGIPNSVTVQFHRVTVFLACDSILDMGFADSLLNNCCTASYLNSLRIHLYLITCIF